NSGSSVFPGGWSALYKLVLCCTSLLLSGVLLEHSDFGLDLDLGPDENFPWPSGSGLLQSRQDSSSSDVVDRVDCSWSLFDDLYFDSVYNVEPAEAREVVDVDDSNTVTSTGKDEVTAVVKRGTKVPQPRKRRRICRSMRSHLASKVWNLSREQRNKLLASRFRDDYLYICDWLGCVHVEEKRN
ncbi:Phytochrome A-associated F-box protein, partial [Linum perenne]